MKTFTHKFFGRLEADATRHVNDDGSEGAIVALTAQVAKGVRLDASIEVAPYATIGGGARIGDSAFIGAHATIGGGARIGDSAFIGPYANIGDGEWWISVGPQGSRNAMLTAVQKPEGLRWWVGCKHNITTDDLRAMVAESHGDSDHAADYLHVIAFVEAHPGRLRKAGAA